MKRMIRFALLSIPVLFVAAPSAQAWGSVQASCHGYGFGCACAKLFPGIHRHGPLYNYGPVYPQPGGCGPGGCSPFAGLFSRWHGDDCDGAGRSGKLLGLFHRDRGDGGCGDGGCVDGGGDWGGLPAGCGTASCGGESSGVIAAYPAAAGVTSTSLRVPAGAGVATIGD